MTNLEDLDLFADEALEDPYPRYRALRDAGPAVHLPVHGIWAITRYEDVRWCLRHEETFCSSNGVGFNADVNAMTAGSVLTTDGPDHARLRRVLIDYLAPRALRDVQDDIAGRADALVAELVDRGSFDAVTDLAAVFPITVVSDLVGLPEEGRDQLLAFADGFFNMLGPGNERTWAGATIAAGIFEYLTTQAARDHLTPGGWGMAIFEAADRGDIEAESILPLMAAYVTAAMDTTVNAIGSAIMAFVAHPDQWALIRRDPAQIPSAFNEILRYETPVQVFSRQATTAHTIGDVTIPAGDRIALLYGSANRDERMWSDPDTFAITRDARAHLAFGFGTHACAGQGLARIEVQSLLEALARRVESFVVAGEPTRHLNNTVRGWAHLPIRVQR